jgi:hypothetical protein
MANNEQTTPETQRGSGMEPDIGIGGDAGAPGGTGRQHGEIEGTDQPQGGGPGTDYGDGTGRDDDVAEEMGAGFQQGTGPSHSGYGGEHGEDRDNNNRPGGQF